MTVFVELCSGLAAVSLSLFDMVPPCSRIGAKTGYAEQIATAFNLRNDPPDRIELVDSDPMLCNALFFLLCRARELADEIRLRGEGSAQLVWTKARECMHIGGLSGAAYWWLYTAGARGGIGGFKGAHCRRPNVDGFTPSRSALARRIEVFHALDLRRVVDVVCGDAASFPVPPGSRVYIDPPYHRAQGYAGQYFPREQVLDTARRLVLDGCTVMVSERTPIGPRAVKLDRSGQTRRSLTRSSEEWLTRI